MFPQILNNMQNLDVYTVYRFTLFTTYFSCFSHSLSSPGHQVYTSLMLHAWH